MAGLGRAAALARAELEAASAHMAACRDRLQRALLVAFPPVCTADCRCLLFGIMRLGFVLGTP